MPVRIKPNHRKRLKKGICRHAHGDCDCDGHVRVGGRPRKTEFGWGANIVSALAMCVCGRVCASDSDRVPTDRIKQGCRVKLEFPHKRDPLCSRSSGCRHQTIICVGRPVCGEILHTRKTFGVIGVCNQAKCVRSTASTTDGRCVPYTDGLVEKVVIPKTDVITVRQNLQCDRVGDTCSRSSTHRLNGRAAYVVFGLIKQAEIAR